MNQIVINLDQCIGCGKCVLDCPQGCLSFKDRHPEFNPNGCMACCHCICVCPAGAMTLEGENPDAYLEYVKEEYDVAPDRLQRFMSMRRSVRSFTDEPITKEEIASLAEAARYAPSAVNANKVRYSIIIDEMDTLHEKVWQGYRKYVQKLNELDASRAQRGKRRIADHERNAKDDKILFGSKAAIIVSAPRVTDATIAATYMELKAHAMGLGVLISEYTVVSLMEVEGAREWLEIPDGYQPAICLLLGHPKVKYLRIPTRVDPDIILK